VTSAAEGETRPWEQQLAFDDAAHRSQLAYLFEKSAFYRAKLTLTAGDLENFRRSDYKSSLVEHVTEV
jgi:hypothetical protein